MNVLVYWFTQTVRLQTAVPMILLYGSKTQSTSLNTNKKGFQTDVVDEQRQDFLIIYKIKDCIKNIIKSIQIIIHD